MREGYPIEAEPANESPPPVRAVEVPVRLAGRRCDQAAAELLPEFSRARLQRWIESGALLLDRRRWRPRDRVCGGERMELRAPAEERRGSWAAQPRALDVIHEDPALLVLDKPAGLVVHPGAGNPDRTLVNALLHLHPELSALPRAGIVHRLDKDTSGLMVVARSLTAHAALVAALAAREVRREYLAVVRGAPARATGTVDAPIGRDPRRRTRMAVQAGGRPALTHYRVVVRSEVASVLRVRLETGRTHQIRVHMSHLGHPLVGDVTYGGRARPGTRLAGLLAGCAPALERQALHAVRLELEHPESGDALRFDSEPAADIAALVAALAAGA